MAVDVDRLAAARPAWTVRQAQRVKQRVSADPRLRRFVLAVALLAWWGNEALVPHDRIRPIRNLIVVMVVFDSVATWSWVTLGIAVEGNPLVARLMEAMGNELGLAVRTVWTVALVVALAWLASRRAVVRPALGLIALVFGLVSLIHANILVWTTRQVIASLVV